MELNWDIEKEPCVIDEALIFTAIINQGPKGDAGKLYKEQGVCYNEVTHLRLDFLDILQIDHLWILTGLTKLQLSSNIIEKINNLEMLVNLKELDLSFNNISRIENLDTLVNLEVFAIFENKISVLENLKKLTKLKVFSVGNNKLTDKENVLYLRKFENLKSLNLSGNPLCNEANFLQFVHAYLPQLVYYEYKMISEAEKNEAKQMFKNDLAAIEISEAAKKEDENEIVVNAKQEEMNKCAFVEYLGGNYLFESLFADDPEGNCILQMGDEIYDNYKEFEKNLSTVAQEIQKCGLKYYASRQEEITEYESAVNQAKNKSFTESRQLLEEFLVQKKDMFSRVKSMLDTDDENEEAMAKLSAEIQEINESFQEMCQKTWRILMEKELYLFEAMEKVNAALGRSLTLQISEFIDAAQANFAQIRSLEEAYFEAAIEVADRYFTRLTLMLAANRDAGDDLPPELLEIMSDKESLNLALTASHDCHLRAIDQREDQLVMSAKTWLREYLDQLNAAEFSRSRSQISEMNHFLDSQKQELQAMMATPMGLLMLPTEIQEALQIK